MPPPPQRDALIDHELYHLEVKLNKSKAIKRDRAGRPKLGMRLHDWELGGFKDIAARHGKHAAEVRAALELKSEYGQFLFDFAKKA